MISFITDREQPHPAMALYYTRDYPWLFTCAAALHRHAFE